MNDFCCALQDLLGWSDTLEQASISTSAKSEKEEERSLGAQSATTGHPDRRMPAPPAPLLPSPRVPTYYTNELALDLPDVGFVDRTVTTLEAITPGGHVHALTVSRAPLADSADLAAHVKANLGRASVQLRSHQVLFVRDAEIASCPAIEVATQWRGALSWIYTRQAHLAVSGQWLVFSANAPLDARETCDELLEQVLGTLRIRD
jgi:hypothetical protein